MCGYNIWPYPVPSSTPAGVQGHPRPPPAACFGRSVGSLSNVLSKLLLLQIQWCLMLTMACLSCPVVRCDPSHWYDACGILLAKDPQGSRGMQRNYIHPTNPACLELGHSCSRQVQPENVCCVMTGTLLQGLLHCVLLTPMITIDNHSDKETLLWSCAPHRDTT